MASPKRATTRSQGGFTLVEMMLALAILVFGVTALSGSMLVGVSTRRGSEMRFRATSLVDQAVHDVQERLFADPKKAGEPLQTYKVTDPPGYAGMQYTVEFREDRARPTVVLVVIKVSWREQGEHMGEEFRRIVVRRASFSRRVQLRRR